MYNSQGPKGIRQWPINWCTSPMMIHNIDLNYFLKRLKTQLTESTNKNLLQSPKLLSNPIRKYYYKTLGTSVTNSPMSPPTLTWIASTQYFLTATPRPSLPPPADDTREKWMVAPKEPVFITDGPPASGSRLRWQPYKPVFLDKPPPTF